VSTEAVGDESAAFVWGKVSAATMAVIEDQLPNPHGVMIGSHLITIIFFDAVNPPAWSL
jgi:hypothetical protein